MSHNDNDRALGIIINDPDMDMDMHVDVDDDADIPRRKYEEFLSHEYRDKNSNNIRPLRTTREHIETYARVNSRSAKLEIRKIGDNFNVICAKIVVECDFPIYANDVENDVAAMVREMVYELIGTARIYGAVNVNRAAHDAIIVRLNKP